MPERRTPFYDFHLRAAGQLVKGGGDFMFPLSYTSPVEEHLNTRTNVGMQDLSTMGEVDIKGPAEQIDFEPHDYDEHMLREFAARYFPQSCGPTMSLAACMFTNSPDNHFIIDLHPGYPQVSFVSACSGHGFKFVSVVGEILADLAERGETRHNIEFFRVGRFNGQQSTVNRQSSTMQRHQPQSSAHPSSFSGQWSVVGGQASTLAEAGKDAIRPFW